MDTNLGKYIFTKLKSTIDLEEQIFVVSRKKQDPFEKLVAIILSQNTNDLNAKKAYLSLKEKIGLKPEKIAKAKLKDIEDAIKTAGLQKQKARSIQNLAKRILDGLNLHEIINLDTEEARKKLMDLPGIGAKTSDVFLAIYGHDTMGIDTHINRISKRIGLVDVKSNYEEVRKKLMKLFRGLNYDLVHRYLIAHGRLFCTAKNPKCDKCPLSEICNYYKNKGKKDKLDKTK